MEFIILTFIGIVALFFIILALKSIFNLRDICVLCISVSLAWIVLLIFYFLEIFNDKIIIAILMGHTSLGIFYLVEYRIGLFKLPFLLTSMSAIYFVLSGFLISVVYFLLILWLLFFGVHIFKTNKNFSSFAEEILECCKKW